VSIVVIDCFFQVPYEWWTLWIVTNPFIIEFLFGCLLFQLFRRISFPRFAGSLFVVLALTWLAALVRWTNIAHLGNSSWLRIAYWARPLCCGLFGFLLLLGAMVMEKQGQLRVGKPLDAVGNWSYPIYLSHEIVCELVARIMNRIAPHGSYVILIVVAIASQS
jgi:peptidoglycan/LPS O-acetylase OafA/YrhL